MNANGGLLDIKLVKMCRSRWSKKIMLMKKTLIQSSYIIFLLKIHINSVRWMKFHKKDYYNCFIIIYKKVLSLALIGRIFSPPEDNHKSVATCLYFLHNKYWWWWVCRLSLSIIGPPICNVTKTNINLIVTNTLRTHPAVILMKGLTFKLIVQIKMIPTKIFF